MSSVKLILKENKANENGEMPVYLRIIEHRKTKFIALPVRAVPSKWDAIKQRVKSSYPNSKRVNAFLAQKVSDAEAAAITLKTNERYVSSKKIKENILGRQPESLIQYAENHINDVKAKGKVGTYRRLKCVLNKLKEYTKNSDMDFNDFDLTFLKNYDRYLRDELKNTQNTIHANLKVFRMLFHAAVREELIEAGINPFPKFQMATEATTKHYLTDEELQAIETLDINEKTVMFHHRNMYVFACYAGGLRVSDLLQLKWENFDGSHIRVMMQKTKELVQIKLPAKALEILNYYAGINAQKAGKNFIFPFLKNAIDYNKPEVLHNAISSNTAFANKNLRVIAAKAGIDKHISFHSSRHSFATRALKKGMRIEHVSKLLGHKKMQTTQIYTKIVNEDLDNAMSVFD